MKEKSPLPPGFSATMRVIAEAKDRDEVLPFLGMALTEKGPVRGEVLRFLLDERNSAAAELVVRAFASLDDRERAEALTRSDWLLKAGSTILAGSDREARRGLAALAQVVPLGEGLNFLLPLIDDPSESVRGRAHETLLHLTREYLEERWTFAGPGQLRQYLLSISMALRAPVRRSTAALDTLVAALARAAREDAEARAHLRAILADDSHPARASVLRCLEESGDPAVAAVLLACLVSGPAPVRTVISSILRRRRDPEFLAALAREAAQRMESPAGIPAAAASVLAQVNWESLPPLELSALPAVAQKRLFSMARMFLGGAPARARRLAVFLHSQDRRIRELALDALRDESPTSFQEALLALLEDPAEEFQLRAADLLLRIPHSEVRRKLLEKAQRSTERVQRFILARLPSSPRRDPRGAALDGGIPRITAAPGAAAGAAAGIEEYSFPLFRALPGTPAGRPS